MQGGLRPAVRVRIDPARVAAYGLSLEDVRTAVAAANVNGAKGGFDGAAPGLCARRQRPAALAGRLQARWSSPTRTAPRSACPTSAAWSAASRTTASPAGTTASQAVVLDIQRQPGANIVATVAAIKEALPALQRAIPAGDPHAGGHRPHRDHPRLGVRRAGHAGDGDRAGRVRHLPVPAQRPRHHHPRRRAAALAGRHVRGDGAVRLQPRQPQPDGADGRDRLRGRRRHRHDRERGPLHRGGLLAAGGRLSRARRRSASPSSR